ncbi:major vault protein-like isoform X6 [Amphibalanus amphitrite]|uniref:major vault protein-like isoform X6 n=1 Tax=Amphibalanus amphitrite TaxID=1232801 RepID=UPI001C922771|nr:major vault protein-like isoform X6 [Amphibalanus amphitrite]XP_043246386.1 major vault protein-like isoform X6 [Amphibalanus amphitrite]
MALDDLQLLNEAAEAIKMSKKDSSSSSDSLFRIPPHYYVHVLDQTANVTRVEVGPQTFIRKDNERVIVGPNAMVVVPPRHYCVVENPVVRGEDGQVVCDASGQARLLHADTEVRLHQDPFPLYPGEKLSSAVLPLKVVPPNKALHLRALREFKEGEVVRSAGDEWLFGPGTYVPRPEVEEVADIKAIIIGPNQALRLRARLETTDWKGQKRVAGEEWLVTRVGAYMPGVYEEVAKMVNAHVLTEKTALLVRATRTFTDSRGVRRKNGEEWLVRFDDMETFIPDVYEEVVEEREVTTLTSRQYCVICDPVGPDGKPQLGQRRLVRGEKSFFLQPGETLEDDVRDNYILQENEALVLRAGEAFTDNTVTPPVTRRPGDRWMVTGPVEFVPPIEVEVVVQQTAIPLDRTEGIYVRNNRTGEVRAVCGQTYMLTQDEELWEKELPASVVELLRTDALADRGGYRELRRSATNKSHDELSDRTRVITYRVPHNAAVQVYDYKAKRSRVVFGPDLVMLEPDEQFTQLSLSGGKPKKPNTIRALSLLLGPDFCTDIVTVETSDHARLSLQIAYNWHFDVGNKTAEDACKIFSVPDFVGDACKAIASRVRGAVAQRPFDDFHKNSAKIIRQSVFGLDDAGKVRKQFVFPQNNLVVTSIDIQSVEPVDQRTRDSLQKSVQLAIEITTNAQEAAAKHEAERTEQEARGRLERQKIKDEAAAEQARKELVELQTACAAIESTGQAKAEAQSRAEAARIEGEAAVEQAGLKARAANIEAESELERLRSAREAELKYTEESNQLEIARSKEMANIEIEKFQQMVSAMGAETLKAMATAGGDHQVRMLQSLGLQSTLITDGRTPISLLNTAQGLVGLGQAAGTESAVQRPR